MSKDLICKGITIKGDRCSRKTDRDYCHQHSPGANVYRELKPAECCICYGSLETQRKALECGHWIHIQCIIRSGKAECPICRTQLHLGKRATEAISNIAALRKREQIEEEQEELRNTDFDDEISHALEDNIIELLQEFLGDTQITFYIDAA